MAKVKRIPQVEGKSKLEKSKSLRKPVKPALTSYKLSRATIRKCKLLLEQDAQNAPKSEKLVTALERGASFASGSYAATQRQRYRTRKRILKRLDGLLTFLDSVDPADHPSLAGELLTEYLSMSAEHRTRKAYISNLQICLMLWQQAIVAEQKYHSSDGALTGRPTEHARFSVLYFILDELEREGFEWTVYEGNIVAKLLRAILPDLGFSASLSDKAMVTLLSKLRASLSGRFSEKAIREEAEAAATARDFSLWPKVRAKDDRA